MSILSELKAALEAKGINTDRKPGGPKVGEGTFGCMVEEASLGKGENGNVRGLIKLKVIEAEDMSSIGGKFNSYIQTKNLDYCLADAVRWAEILKSEGVGEDKIFDGEKGALPVLAAVLNAVNKQALIKGLKVSIDRRAQKPNAQGQVFYNNYVSLYIPAVPEAVETEEVEDEFEKKPKSKAKKVLNLDEDED